MNCAFIISPSYSGSTLLSMLLAHHPQLVTLGEFLDTHKRKHREGEGNFCSCGAHLTECPYLRDLTTRLTEKGIPFSVDFPDTAFIGRNRFAARILRSYIRGTGFELLRRAAIGLSPDIKQTVQRTCARNAAVIGTILEKERAAVYLDSAKNNNRVVYFDRYATDIDVRVIWLVRDGRGVTNSIMRHAGVEVAEAAQRWSLAQQSVIRTAQMIAPERVLRIKYEELCVDPEAVLSRICVHLGLEPSSMPSEFGETEVHLTGNNMRLNGLAEIRPDVKWRESWGAQQLEEFAAVGGPLNKHLGYGT